MAVLDTSILVNYYFEELTKIPHGSFHEEAIADYVESIAKEYHLDYRRDEMNNIVVFKAGTQGYEDHEPLMLEAHLDMVCEKNSDSHHDFENDPLDLYIKDGFLHAKGTTLGADDGYGVSYMLALLTEEGVKHPPLECVFTVQEEVGLCGALAFDASDLKAKRMIGLDSGEAGETCTSSSGGNDLLITKPVIGDDNDSPVYVFSVRGLLGGHSGACIDKARGNANKIAARVLYRLLKEGVDVRLVDITGGLKNNAIPRECIVTFASESDPEQIAAIIELCEANIRKEFENSDPDVYFELDEGESDICICAKDSESVISIMYLAINGLIEKSQVIPDLTTISLNMGIVRTYDDCITIHYSLRSPLQSAREELSMQLEYIAQIFNGFVEVSNDYPGWDYDPHSILRKQLSDFYYQSTGEKLREVATHGGLETGAFKGKIPELDIVTFGPDMADIHTPDERLNIKSFVETYQFLKDFIETL